MDRLCFWLIGTNASGCILLTTIGRLLFIRSDNAEHSQSYITCQLSLLTISNPRQTGREMALHGVLAKRVWAIKVLQTLASKAEQVAMV